MTRKQRILARAGRATRAADKIRLHMLAAEEKTIRDVAGAKTDYANR